jgi:Arf-GAP domain and FG repeat-containing protein 1
MAATTKKKQDDKNLKRLRELVSSPDNKKCAECRSRGPTYADMTVNSFVCTTCSGLLRGLNPPHRVKSITMTSFTADEMARLEEGGNEKLNNIWLARWNERSDTEPDANDDQKMKYFLIEKYERKRWYDEQGKKTAATAMAGNATPETKPLSSLLGNQAPKLVVTNKQAVRFNQILKILNIKLSLTFVNMFAVIRVLNPL